MSNQNLRLAIVLAVGLIPNMVSAQHEAHQPAGAQAPSAELTQCLRVQPVIENVISRAMARAEAARLSNSPSELRAAVDHLEAALRDIRAQAAPCAAAAASSAPHAGHSSAQPGDKQTDWLKWALRSGEVIHDPSAGGGIVASLCVVPLLQ